MTTAYSVQQNLEAQRFEIAIDGAYAVAEYEFSNGLIRFTHTRVPSALKGLGLATALVEAGLKAAADNGWLVTPQCAFFAAYMRKHPETRGLLSDAGRVVLDESQPV